MGRRTSSCQARGWLAAAQVPRNPTFCTCLVHNPVAVTEYWLVGKVTQTWSLKSRGASVVQSLAVWLYVWRKVVGTTCVRSRYAHLGKRAREGRRRGREVRCYSCDTPASQKLQGTSLAHTVRLPELIVPGICTRGVS